MFLSVRGCIVGYSQTNASDFCRSVATSNPTSVYVFDSIDVIYARLAEGSRRFLGGVRLAEIGV